MASARRALLPFLVAIVLAAPPTGSAQGALPPDALFLRGDLPFELNMTTYPPNATEPIALEPFAATATGARWLWSVPYPERWSASAGTAFEVVLFFDRLEGVVPVADPTTDPDGLGRLKIAAHLRNGETLYDTASASTTMDPFWPGAASGRIEVRLTITTTEDLTWDPDAEEASGFGLDVDLTGLMRAEARARLLVESIDTPSRLVAPGFPAAAFRAWEDAERAEEECNRLVLEGRECPVPPGRGEDEEDQERPAPAGALAALAVAAAAMRVAGRRRR